MRRTIQLVLLFCVAIGAMTFAKPSIVFACSCVAPPSVETQVSRSEAVFTGRALQVEEQKGVRGNIMKAALFEVDQIWKGGAESQIIIHTGSGGGDCGYHFEPGVEYLVYAHHTEMYGDKEQLVTIICDRTKAVSDAQEDLEILGVGRAPTNQVNLARELESGRAGTDLGKFLVMDGRITAEVWVAVAGVVLVGVVLVYALRRKKG